MRSLLLALVLPAAALVARDASAQPSRCAPPRMPVVVLWTGGMLGSVHRPRTQCLTRGEFERMRRARGGWRCTPPRGNRPAACTAINVPRAAPGR